MSPERTRKAQTGQPVARADARMRISGILIIEYMESHDTARTGVIAVRGRGFGFVSLPDRDEDIFIPPEELERALDGDVVEIAITGTSDRTGERPTGRVVRVLERARSEYIGTVEVREDAYVLRADNRRIHRQFLLPDASPDDVGMKVAVALGTWERPDHDPTGRIVEVLGRAGEHETEMQAILRSGGFASDFPPAVQHAAQQLHETRAAIFDEAARDEKRKDFREVPTCTIDPADAKDFDDALSFRELPDGTYEIGIHIADVSHYVREDDAIDREAQERGTSIYLVDRVIPMLPEVLSNDLCSLRPGEDRLAFAAVFTMSRDGTVIDEWYGQTLIHSDKRFTYQEAQDVLDTGAGPMHDALAALMHVARILRTERYQRGAIAFEQPEVRFELDENGAPLNVYVKERIEAMLMVEDFMLLANRKVAEHIHTLSKQNGAKNAAFIYRVHDAPKAEKIEDLGIFLRALGYEFRSEGGVVEATDINKLLSEIAGTPEENLIKTATIRSMAKAIYTTKNIGHFGLAFKYYTHFTSPIRRYPDLMVHRLLRRHLDGTPVTPQERARYEQLSVQCSEKELEAVTAERDSIKYKQVEYLADKVGETFDGVVTGVAEWGIYVEEKQSRGEGMVKLASIKGDYYTHDPKNYRVKGDRTGTTYRLGDEVRIKLVGANVAERQLDFVLV